MFGGVNARKDKALACQVDEEEGIFSMEAYLVEANEKGRLARSLEVLRCLSPLAALRELRSSGSLKDESVDVASDSSQAKYYVVVDENDSNEAVGANDVRLLFHEGTLDSEHDLASELFNTTGSLKVVEEGTEWDEDQDSDEEHEKVFPECHSPATYTTARSEESSNMLVTSIDLVDYPACEVQNQVNLLSTDALYVKQPLDSKRTIRPFSVPGPSVDALTQHGDVLEPTKPDPPASRDAGLSVSGDFIFASDETNMGQFTAITIPKKPDCDRTVVSELSFDSFSDFVATRPDQHVFHQAGEPLVTRMRRFRETIKSEQKRGDGEKAETPLSTSQGNSKKLQDLISKFESLSSSKVSLERFSVISKIERQEESNRSTINADPSSAFADVSTSQAEGKNDSGDHRFFWRSYPIPPQGFDRDQIDAQNANGVAFGCSIVDHRPTERMFKPKLVDV